ncbi:tetratricopeptide repeat protein [Pirellula sp. SH-Sr6A]|uniref:tetratricopeptide repeat protein n=1 Tax=Pirellula sp. SH-Sr6A TaxID=1632865 RepID=UPI00078D5EC5|nr:tetratricopeptide repeat protein [Pirellula sp. SH-Sr6A]AMV32513.1 tetratricopeptide repeat protein [Pirellula sp. SH-Sr6A]
MPNSSARRRLAPANPDKPVSSFERAHGKTPRWFGLLLAATVAASVVLLIALILTPLTPVEEPSTAIIPLVETDSVEAVKRKLETRSNAIPTRRVVLPLEGRKINNELEQADLLERLEGARSQFAEDAVVHRIAGITYAELQLSEQAAECFERSLQLQPQSVQTAVEYAALLSQTGKQDQAIERLSKLKDAPDSDAKLFQTLGSAMMQQGEIEEAILLFKKGLAKYSNETKLLSLLAQAQNQAGEFAAAESNARRAMELGDSGESLVMALSTSLIRQGKREEGLAVRQQHSQKKVTPKIDDETYKESFAQFASHTYGLLATVYESHGDAQSAEKWRVFGLEMNPANTRILVSLGEMLRKSGRLDEAIPIYQRLLVLEPDNMAHYNNLASLALSKQDIRLAISALEQGAGRDPTGYLSLQTARVAFEVGDGIKAERYASDAASKMKTPDAYLLWIAVLRGLQKDQAAFKTLATAKALFPNDPRFQQIP